MKNKYFVSFNLPVEELRKLDDLALHAQIMFWAHAIDKCLSSNDKISIDKLSNMLSFLDKRLIVYIELYGEKGKSIHWALKIKDLCEKTIEDVTGYLYPFKSKIKISIPDFEFDNLIKGRRSIRTFTGEPVEKETIYKILEYASWAPSSCHEQGLRYIILKSQESKMKIKRFGVDIENSAFIIVVLADLRLYCDSDIECTCHDSGAAIQNILLACHYFGLGSCYISDIDLNSKNNRSLVPVKEYEKITAFVVVGHYDKEPITPERIDIEKITVFC